MIHGNSQFDPKFILLKHLFPTNSTILTMRNIAFLFLFFCATIQTLQSQIFPCDGSVYISQNSTEINSPTAIYRLSITADTIVFEQIAVTDIHSNATGYSSTDNFIYGITQGSNDIFQIRADGSASVVISENTIAGFASGAGDVRATDSTYIVHHRGNETLFFYKLTDPVVKVHEVQLRWSAASSNTGIANLDIDDIAVDPFDPTIAYSYQRGYASVGPIGTRGSLLIIDIDPNSATFGEVTEIGQIDVGNIVHLGSLFFDGNGNLFGYGSQIPPPILQNTLISIDKVTAVSEVLAMGPGAPNSDGCTCPFYFDLEKTAEVIDGCDTSFVTFEISMANNSADSLFGFTFRDTLPDGFTITEVSPADGNIGGNLSILSNPPRVVLEDGVLDRNATGTFQIQAFTLQSGTYENGAFVLDLPARYGGAIRSDDPETLEDEDATVFEVALSGDLVEIAIDAVFCTGDTVEINGQIFTSAGAFTDTLGHANGCDTVLHIGILEFPIGEGSVEYFILPGENIVVNGIQYSEPGVNYQLLEGAASNGCDSFLTIRILSVQTVLHYDFNDCSSYAQIGTNIDYNDFPPAYPESLVCGSLDASIVHREMATENPHSCTPGVEESPAMCVSAAEDCAYDPGNLKSVRFEINVTPEPDSVVAVIGLSFFEKAPENFEWLDGLSGPNNYPTLYAVRVLKNDVEIYNEFDLPTTLDWTREFFDFRNMEAFVVNEAANFQFELLAYCLIGNSAQVAAWDLDELSVMMSCKPVEANPAPFDISIIPFEEEPTERVEEMHPEETSTLQIARALSFPQNTLFQNRPNPFSGETIIPFQITAEGRVELQIYDLSGRVIWKTGNRFVPGYHEVAVDFNALAVEPGVLICRLESNGFVMSKRMVLVR